MMLARACRSWVRRSSTYTQKHTRVRGEPIPAEVAARSPGIQTLSARLHLQDIAPQALARTLVDNTSTLKFTTNAGPSRFGKRLLSYHVYEYFMMKHPRLPASILKHVAYAYTNVAALAELATMWGVQSDTRSPLSRYLSSTSDEQVVGRLSYTDKRTVVEQGVEQLSEAGATDERAALGYFVRALVATVYAHRGLEAAGDFVHTHVISPRKLDVASVMAFSRPTRELAVLCARENLEEPVARLMVESGRYSLAPVFVVGVFSGRQKLGEGQGSSLREARTRAAVNALQSWYLYSPAAVQLPSQRHDTSLPSLIDAGEIII